MIKKVILKINKDTILFIILFIVHGYIFWPGLLSPDSQAQYQHAISGIYNDHHPIMMAFLWRFLLYFYPGPGLMFIFHLSLLYGSVYYLRTCLPSDKKRFILLLPFIPSVFVYSGFIWKDVSFAYSFLFIGSVLASLNIANQPLRLSKGILLGVLLFYGASVKYQARYCVPLLLLWISYSSLIAYDVKTHLKRFFILSGLLMVCSMGFDAIMQPKVKMNHSWQYVKIFDLAAITVETDRFLLPDFMKTHYFTMDKLRQLTNYQRVDDLVFPADAILKLAQNPLQRQQLENMWWHAVFTHPWIYLKHRVCVLAFTLGGTREGGNIKQFITSLPLPDLIMSPLLILSRIFGYLFLSHFLQIFGSLVYLCLSLRALSLTKYAVPLFFFNGMGLTFTGVLLFCSMAGTPRYTYGAICFFHASHFFAYRCYQVLKEHLAPLNAR